MVFERPLSLFPRTSLPRLRPAPPPLLRLAHFRDLCCSEEPGGQVTYGRPGVRLWLLGQTADYGLHENKLRLAPRKQLQAHVVLMRMTGDVCG